MIPCKPADDLDAQIARLELELAKRKQERADRQDALFLQLIARSIPIGVAFNTGEVIEHAAVDPDLARTIANMTAKEIGRRLARLARRPLMTSVVLVYVGRDRRGCIWTIAQTSSR